MKNSSIFCLLLLASQISLAGKDFSYNGNQYCPAELSEMLYDEMLNNYNFSTWDQLKNKCFLIAAIKCYENMDKNDTRLSNKAKYDLQNILNYATSFFKDSNNIRFRCKAFCLMYGGYLLSDEQMIVNEVVKQIKELKNK